GGRLQRRQHLPAHRRELGPHALRPRRRHRFRARPRDLRERRRQPQRLGRVRGPRPREDGGGHAGGGSRLPRLEGRQRRRRGGRACPRPGLPGPARGHDMPLKRAAASALAAAALLAAGATRVQAQAALAVDPASSSVRPGESVSVTVDLSGATDAYAFQFDVTWDPTLLELTSVASGSFLPDANFSPGITSPGSVTFVYDLLTGPVAGASGGGTLPTLTFHAFAGRFGSSPIHLANVILLDSRGKDVPLASVTGATIDYLDDVPPVTTAAADPLPNASGWN